MKFKVEPSQDAASVRLTGDIDDDIDAVLVAVEKAAGKKDLVIDCDEIGKINSIGVKGWIGAIQRWKATRKVSFKCCHHNFIDMAIMVPAFTEGCRIMSLQATFVCEECARERLLLVEFKEKLAVMPHDLICTKCAGKLKSADLESDVEFVVANS